jgi:hypothetical protein
VLDFPTTFHRGIEMSEQLIAPAPMNFTFFDGVKDGVSFKYTPSIEIKYGDHSAVILCRPEEGYGFGPEINDERREFARTVVARFNFLKDMPTPQLEAGAAPYTQIADWNKKLIQDRDRLATSLQELIDLCALGDVDENTEAHGWGHAITEAKASIVMARTC